MAPDKKIPVKTPKNGAERNPSSPAPVDQGIAVGDDPDDVWSTTRKACINAVLKTFQSIKSKNKDSHSLQEYKLSPQSAAATYEKALYKKNSHSLNAYKRRFRKDLTALKNAKTDFAVNILAGELDIADFVNLNENELISKIQKEKNSKLLSDELKNSMGKQFPTNINQIKNQNVFVGEKWGISESAAKIDPEFDQE